jgi:hypothetical protein
MPPKSAVIIKELREKFPQDAAAAIVESWATNTIPQLDVIAAAVQNFQLPADSTQAPASILEILDSLRTAQASVVSDLHKVRSTIVVRIPEMKEEDNLGVSVQMNVLKLFDEVEKQILASDKASFATISFKASYLESRAAVEDKLNPSGKDAQPSKAPSLILQLQQIDRDAALVAFLTLSKLATSLRALVTVYAENAKKLINPRVSNDRMIS